MLFYQPCQNRALRQQRPIQALVQGPRPKPGSCGQMSRTKHMYNRLSRIRNCMLRVEAKQSLLALMEAQAPVRGQGRAAYDAC